MDKKNRKEDDKNKFWKLESRWDIWLQRAEKGESYANSREAEKQFDFPYKPPKKFKHWQQKVLEVQVKVELK